MHSDFGRTKPKSSIFSEGGASYKVGFVVGTGSGLPNSRSGHASQFAPLAFDGMRGR
jgi:hypothetical protein